MTYGGIFDVASKIERLEELNLELENPALWDNPQVATKITKEKATLDNLVNTMSRLDGALEDSSAMLELAVEADDDSLLAEVEAMLATAAAVVDELEFQRMFGEEMDANNCYLDIQSGSGGTEAQDWAEMLLRMYLRFCESKGFKVQIMELSAGAVAGIKSASVAVLSS